MSFNQIPFRTGRHKRSVPPRATCLHLRGPLSVGYCNGERPQFLQLEYLHKTFTLELIERTHELPRTLPHGVSLPLYPSETCMLAVVLKSLPCSQYSELLLPLQHHLSPLLLKALSERSAFPLSLPGTRVVFLWLKQFSSVFETEAEVTLTFIKLISGETDAGEPRPGWMTVLAMEIMRGKVPLYSSFLAHWLTGTRPRDPLRI